MSLTPPGSAHSESRWAKELLHFAMQATRISCSTFYWIDDRHQMIFVANEGVARDTLSLYQSKFHVHDPCRATRLIATESKIQTLKNACAAAGDEEVALYRPYMELSGIKDAMDLLFWHEGRPIGGLGMMAKGAQTSIKPETITLARSLRRYVEASLAYHPHVLRSSARQRQKDLYQLSARETEVADLIAQGLTNHEISEALGIGMPTVKTHIQSLFRKTGVINRTSLIAELQ